jgi:hypothetical protein
LSPTADTKSAGRQEKSMTKEQRRLRQLVFEAVTARQGALEDQGASRERLADYDAAFELVRDMIR